MLAVDNPLSQLPISFMEEVCLLRIHECCLSFRFLYSFVSGGQY
jgi:hypothetical protein